MKVRTFSRVSTHSTGFVECEKWQPIPKIGINLIRMIKYIENKMKFVNKMKIKVHKKDDSLFLHSPPLSSILVFLYSRHIHSSKSLAFKFDAVENRVSFLSRWKKSWNLINVELNIKEIFLSSREKMERKRKVFPSSPEYFCSEIQPQDEEKKFSQILFEVRTSCITFISFNVHTHSLDVMFFSRKLFFSSFQNIHIIITAHTCMSV